MGGGILKQDSSSSLGSCILRFVKNNSYYIAFFIYGVWTWLSRSSFIDGGEDNAVAIKLLERIVQIVVVVLLGMAFLRMRATPHEFLAAIALTLLGFIVWQTAGEGWLFWLALFVVCGSGVRLRPLALSAFAAALLSTLLVVTASTAGLIENDIAIRNATGVARNPMGFDHPNTFGAALLVICASLLTLLEGGKARRILLTVPCCLVAAGIALFVADSRTAALCLIAFVACIPVYILIRSKSWGHRAAMVLLILLMMMVGVSVGYTVFYDPSRPFDSMLNDVLSGRIRLANMYFHDHAPGLFGYDYSGGAVTCVDGKELTFVVDNLYAHVLLRHGVLAFAILFFGVVALCTKMYKQRYFGPVLLGMGLFLVYGMSETLGCRVECNFFVISLWTVLYHRPVSEFDDTGGGEPAAAEPESVHAGELSFFEFAMLPLNAVRRRHG